MTTDPTEEKQTVYVPGFPEPLYFPKSMTDEQIATVIDGMSYKDFGVVGNVPGRPPAQPVVHTPERNRAAEFGGGLLSGAADVGNAVLSPVRVGARLLAPDSGVSNYLDGLTASNEDVEKTMADSGYFTGGKLAAQIGATLPVGGAVAGGARMIPAVARAAPNLLRAIETGGFVGPQNASRLARAGTKMAGGAVAGGASTALVGPQDTGMGALIGAAVPFAGPVAGWLGSKTAQGIFGGAGDKQKVDLAKWAIERGYAIPPSDIKPQDALTVLMEGLSGKIKTAQQASVKNQAKFNEAGRKELGLPADAPLDLDVLKRFRNKAGQEYNAVANTGVVTPGPQYDAALDAIVAPFKKAGQGFPNARPNPVIDKIESLRSSQFDAESAVEMLKDVREQAGAAYARGEAGEGRALKSAAKALEDAMDEHLVKIGAPPDQLAAFRKARQDIAKSYSIQSALNPSTGDVSGTRLASQLDRGKPLSGDLLDAARVAQGFPKATQALKEAPKQISPLDWAAAFASSVGTHNPLGLATLLARPITRTALLSKPFQKYAAGLDLLPAPLRNAGQRVAASAPLQALANNPGLIYRGAPVIAAEQDGP